jgi:aryl-alcohol dehydrogenase-like predicted oxidoreductase
VSEIGYGMWGMGGWTGSDDQESLRALDRAFALGCTFFDTARSAARRPMSRRRFRRRT